MSAFNGCLEEAAESQLLTALLVKSGAMHSMLGRLLEDTPLQQVGLALAI